MVNSVTSATGDSTSGIPITVEGSQSFGNVFSTARQAFEEMNSYNIGNMVISGSYLKTHFGTVNTACIHLRLRTWRHV